MGTPEYRSPQHLSQVPQKQTMPQPNQQNQSSQPNQKTISYAGAARKPATNTFPKKDQAIIINVIDGLTLSDYVIRLADLIGGGNILFASRISNNRICLYLSSKQIVEDVINHHSTIRIHNQETSIRRLVSPARRIILSNVAPTIPHELLEDTIRDLGFKPVSPVTLLRAGVSRDDALTFLASGVRYMFTPMTQ